MPIKNLQKLTDKIRENNLRKEVTFNVLVKDKLIGPGLFYLKHKDSIQREYYVVVTSKKSPNIYLNPPQEIRVF
jgi:hypothetical protein